MNTPRNLIDHLEQYLGRIERGWSKDADGRSVPFNVALFDGDPLDEAQALTTTGLSHTPLRLNDGRRVRMEFVMLFSKAFGPRNLPGVLQQVGLEALSSDRAPVRGDVLGPRGVLVPSTRFEALYVSIPVWLPDGFHAFEPPEGGEPVVLVWLVPITAREAEYVRSHGWDAFEDRLVEQQPDLLDLDRDELEVCS
jgi:hypothetical protein